MRRGTTRALSRIRPNRRTAPLQPNQEPISGQIPTKIKRIVAAVMALISIQCFAGETNSPPTNAIPGKSNALWLSFTNATPSDRRTPLRHYGPPFPGTNGFGDGAQLRMRSEMLRGRLKPALQAAAKSNRLGDYWL